MTELLRALLFTGTDIWMSIYPPVFVSGLLFGGFFLLFLRFVGTEDAMFRKVLIMVAMVKIALPPFIGLRIIPAPNRQIAYNTIAAGVHHRAVGLDEWLFLVWLTGCVLAVGYVAYRYFLSYRMTGQLTKIGFTNVYEGKQGPLVRGILFPKIVVPRGFTELSQHERDAVLEHERAHIRGGDQIIGLLAHIVVCFNWVNPFSFLLLAKLRDSAEMVADDIARKRTGRTGQSYAGNLIDLSEMFSTAGVTGLSAFSRTHGNLKQRITYQLRKEASMKWWKIAIIGLLMITAITVFSVEPKEKDVSVEIDKVDGKMVIKVDEGGEITEHVVDITENGEGSIMFFDDNGGTTKTIDISGPDGTTKKTKVTVYSADDSEDTENEDLDEIEEQLKIYIQNVDEGDASVSTILRDISDIIEDAVDEIDEEIVIEGDEDAKTVRVVKTSAVISKDKKLEDIEDTENLGEGIWVTTDGDTKVIKVNSINLNSSDDGSTIIMIDEDGNEIELSGKDEAVVKAKIEMIIDEDGNVRKKVIESESSNKKKGEK